MSVKDILASFVAIPKENFPSTEKFRPRPVQRHEPTAIFKWF
jgi:hypothetical protein